MGSEMCIRDRPTGAFSGASSSGGFGALAKQASTESGSIFGSGGNLIQEDKPVFGGATVASRRTEPQDSGTPDTSGSFSFGSLGGLLGESKQEGPQESKPSPASVQPKQDEKPAFSFAQPLKDEKPTFSFAQPKQDEKPAFPFAQPQKDDKPAFSFACLLYTSDAADE